MRNIVTVVSTLLPVKQLDVVRTYKYNNIIHTGVYLSLKGTVYPNNSVISITEIGETDIESTSPPQNSNNGLQCITDRMPCCRFGDAQAGEWFFPDGTVVPMSGPPFYRNRGHDDGTVNLNRANTNVMMPTGLFCCVVPDATGANQTLCADISELVTGCDIFRY